VANSVGPSNVVTVNLTILGNQCTAGPTCALHQVLILPVVPATLTMSQAAFGGPGNPTATQAILGGVVSGLNCGPGPIVLNGQPQTACGILNPLTVVNARGTDAKWDVTGQVGDFLDGTRGPTDHCSTNPKNIAQNPPNNHCIPGNNLGWVPTNFIMDPSVPGDTAAAIAGAIILPPNTTAQTPPTLPSATAQRTNVNTVLSPYSLLTAPPASLAAPVPGPGLLDVAQELCGAPTNQSGGTFQCDAGLLLAVPGSAAAGTYTATMTLTLG